MPVLKLDADFSGVIRAYDKAVEKSDELGTSTGRTSSAMEMMGRRASRVLSDLQTPSEKYARKLEEIDMLAKRGAITADQQATAAGRLKEKYEEAGNAGKKSFGAEALQSVVAFAAGFATVSTAVGLVKSAFETMNEEREKAMRSTDDYADSFKKLYEYAAGNKDQKHGDELVNLGEDLYKNTGRNRGELSEIVAQADASDTVDELKKPEVQKLIKDKNLNGEVMQAIEQIRMAYGKDKVSFGQVINNGFAAATLAPGQMAPVLKAMSSATLLGANEKFNLNDLMAAAAVVMKTSGVENGGTNFTNLINKLPAARKQYGIDENLPLLDQVEAVYKKEAEMETTIRPAAEKKKKAATQAVESNKAQTEADEDKERALGAQVEAAREEERQATDAAQAQSQAAAEKLSRVRHLAALHGKSNRQALLAARSRGEETASDAEIEAANQQVENAKAKGEDLSFDDGKSDDAVDAAKHKVAALQAQHKALAGVLAQDRATGKELTKASKEADTEYDATEGVTGLIPKGGDSVEHQIRSKKAQLALGRNIQMARDIKASVDGGFDYTGKITRDVESNNIMNASDVLKKEQAKADSGNLIDQGAAATMAEAILTAKKEDSRHKNELGMMSAINRGVIMPFERKTTSNEGYIQQFLAQQASKKRAGLDGHIEENDYKIDNPELEGEALAFALKNPGILRGALKDERKPIAQKFGLDKNLPAAEYKDFVENGNTSKEAQRLLMQAATLMIEAAHAHKEAAAATKGAAESKAGQRPATPVRNPSANQEGR